jgi:hypothetical protein
MEQSDFVLWWHHGPRRAASSEKFLGIEMNEDYARLQITIQSGADPQEVETLRPGDFYMTFSRASSSFR